MVTLGGYARLTKPSICQTGWAVYDSCQQLALARRMAVVRALALALFLSLGAAPAAECDVAANSTAACRELGCALL